MGVSRPIDVEPKHLKILLGLLENHLPGVSVWVFGSRVKWTSRPDSDLDLVVFAKPEQSRNVHALKEALEESSLPFRVDVLVWDVISNAFHDNIRKDYVELVSGAKEPGVQCASRTTAYVADTCKLSDIADVQGGFAFKSADFSDSGVAIVKIANVQPPSVSLVGVDRIPPEKLKGLERFELHDGDVLMAMTGATVGKVGRFRRTEPAYLNQRVARISAKQGRLFDDFVYAVVSLPGFDKLIEGASAGSAQANISAAGIGSVVIPKLSDGEQIQIGRIARMLDDRIALLRETNATLEAIAQALFKSWFVDFDPAHARARGEQPEGLSEPLAALFPDSFEESPLGLVPRGWRLVPFGELLNHTIGGDWGDEAPNDKNDTQVAIIRGTDMPDLQGGVTGRVPVRYTSQKKLASRKLQDGDLVLEVSGGSKDQPTGRSLYMTDGLLGQFDCPVEPASFCRLLRPASQELGVLLSQHMTYIYADGKTWQYQNQSTGIANFQTTHFLETELVAVPTDDVLKAFAEAVRPMIDRSHLTQIAQLAALRDTLLPRLISGQLRLPEAEALAEEMQA